MRIDIENSRKQLQRDCKIVVKRKKRKKRGGGDYEKGPATMPGPSR